MKIKHAIFDLDGVLVDSLEANHISLMQTMEKFGFAKDESDYLELPIPTTEKLEYLETTQGRTLTDSEKKEFLRVKYELLTKQIHLLKFNLMSKLAVKCLQAKGITLSYATNARKDYALMILDRLDLTSTAELVIGNDCGMPHKPHPDIFYYISSKVNISPEHILVIDDSAANIASASAAGFQTFKVNDFSDLLKVPT